MTRAAPKPKRAAVPDAASPRPMLRQILDNLGLTVEGGRVTGVHVGGRLATRTS